MEQVQNQIGQVEKVSKEEKLWEGFEKECKLNNVSKQTIKTYKNAYISFFHFLHVTRTGKPTRDDVIKYQEELKQTHKSSTVQLYIIAIKLFFKWTAKNHIYPNIAKGVKGVKIDRMPKKGYLSVEMAQQLLNSIGTEKKSETDLRDFLLLSLIMICGLRASEVCNLNWENLVIRDQAWVLVIKKANNQNPEFVVVPEILLNLLMDYRSKVEKNLDSGPIFTSFSGNNTFGRLTPRSVSRICKTRLKDAGFDSNLCASSLRYTSIILALKNGKPIEEVQQAARHKNIASTTIYKRVLKAEENTCSTSTADSIFIKQKTK